MTDVISSGDKTVLAHADGHRRGLTGSDAAFLGAHFNAAADRDILDAVRDGQRHLVDVVHTTSKSGELATEKVGAANALATATAELRLSKEILKEACDTRALVREDGQKTRDLINDLETQRLRDLANAQNAQIIQLRLQLGQPV